MRRLLAVLAPLTLAGCIGAAIHAGGLVADRGTAAAATEAAQAGDPAAQYRLGEAYCCAAFGSGGLLKSNQTATLWLCRAARQGYAPAQLRLARIYAGDRVTGLALKERLVATAAEIRTDRPVAWNWAQLAAAASDRDIAAEARTLGDSLQRAMPPAERIRAAALARPGSPLPCEWKEVFPPG